MTSSSQKIRWLIRDLALLPLKLPGMTGLCRRLGDNSVILSFHNVLPHSFDSSNLTHNVDLTQETFEQHLKFLTSHYDVRPASEIHSLPDQSKQSGVFLSFDDGLRNNYDTIEPILDKYGLTAVFAVCPAFIDRDLHFIWRDWLYLGLRDALANQRELPDTIKTMQDQSLEKCFRALCPKLYAEPSIYSQLAECAMTHRPLAILDDIELLDELQQSQEKISEKLNDQCRTLVYPYGDHKRVDSRSIKFAQKAGYDLAMMNIRESTGDMFALPRFSLPNTTDSAHLVGTVSGLLSWWR